MITMTMKEFIAKNKEELDIAILRQMGCWIQGTYTCSCDKKHINDTERRMWILNDESLYRWARMNRVKI